MVSLLLVQHLENSQNVTQIYMRVLTRYKIKCTELYNSPLMSNLHRPFMHYYYYTLMMRVHTVALTDLIYRIKLNLTSIEHLIFCTVIFVGLVIIYRRLYTFVNFRKKEMLYSRIIICDQHFTGITL